MLADRQWRSRGEGALPKGLLHGKIYSRIPAQGNFENRVTLTILDFLRPFGPGVGSPRRGRQGSGGRTATSRFPVPSRGRSGTAGPLQIPVQARPRCVDLRIQDSCGQSLRDLDASQKRGLLKNRRPHTSKTFALAMRFSLQFNGASESYELCSPTIGPISGGQALGNAVGCFLLESCAERIAILPAFRTAADSLSIAQLRFVAFNRIIQAFQFSF